MGSIHCSQENFATIKMCSWIWLQLVKELQYCDQLHLEWLIRRFGISMVHSLGYSCFTCWKIRAYRIHMASWCAEKESPCMQDETLPKSTWAVVCFEWTCSIWSPNWDDPPLVLAHEGLGNNYLEVWAIWCLQHVALNIWLGSSSFLLVLPIVKRLSIGWRHTTIDQK